MRPLVLSKYAVLVVSAMIYAKIQVTLKDVHFIANP